MILTESQRIIIKKLIVIAEDEGEGFIAEWLEDSQKELEEEVEK